MANQTTKPRARLWRRSQTWSVYGLGHEVKNVCLDTALSHWNRAVLANATGKQLQDK